jgi:hypothetical protein
MSQSNTIKNHKSSVNSPGPFQQSIKGAKYFKLKKINNGKNAKKVIL